MEIKIIECPNNNRLPTDDVQAPFWSFRRESAELPPCEVVKTTSFVTASYGNILARMKRIWVCGSHAPISWPSLLNMENRSHSYLVCVWITINSDSFTKRRFSQSSRYETVRAAMASTTSFSPSVPSTSFSSSSPSDSSGSGGKSFSS
jgi:hypothetical protein